MNNISIQIDTTNGTGSLSANQILTRMIFRSQLPVSCYNFFPSNIAGLPCSYNLCIDSKNHTAYQEKLDLLVSLSPKTLEKNITHLKEDGVLVTDQKNASLINYKGCHYNLPISKEVSSIPDISVKIKTLLKNIVYVGLLSEWLRLDDKICTTVLKDIFKDDKILEWNLQAFLKGRVLAQQNPLPDSFQKLELQAKNSNNLAKQNRSPDSFTKLELQAKNSNNLEPQILMDGNTAMALGALFAGCQFVSWYPITPSSSLVENFEKFASQYQIDEDGKKRYVVLQAEDEIAAITQVIGAGWAGLRAMTSTSGPGLSLMAEAAGLSYFAEVPAVICNIQRVGPSTGLPTRTQQSDLLSSCFLSHGDSRHIVLMPETLEECFSFMKVAFDLSEHLQTLVIVLGDLNLGMNLQTSSFFDFNKEKLNRGKVLRAEDLKSAKLKSEEFYRYQDKDGDGIPYRVLPGTESDKSSYLTRGSGHNEKAEYSENPKDFQKKLDRLNQKWETAKTLVPKASIDEQKGSSLAFISFGNNTKAIEEMRYELQSKQSLASSFMCIKAFPFGKEVEAFLNSQSQIFVVEQNQQGQLKQLLSQEFPQQAFKLKSILQYDGRPFYVENIRKQLKNNAHKTK